MNDLTGDAGDDRLGALVSRRRFGKFVSVGAVGTLCDTVVLLTLVEVFGVLEEVAALIGIEVAILVMFTLNEFWTYREAGASGWRPTGRRLGRSHVVRAAGATVQLLVFTVIFRVFFTSVTFAGIEMWLLVAKGGGIACGTVVNYVFETLFTWRVQSS